MSNRSVARDDLLRVQQGRCHYCRCHLLPADVDSPRAVTFEHRVPKCLGGRVGVLNGVASCRACNTRKGAMSEAEFLAASRPGKSRPKPKKRHDAELARERSERKMRERRALHS